MHLCDQTDSKRMVSVYFHRGGKHFERLGFSQQKIEPLGFRPSQ